MKTNLTNLIGLFAAAAVAALTGCGGGGSSSDSVVTVPPPAPAPAPVPGPAPAPAPAPAPGGSINTTPQTSTYAVGSPEYAAFVQLNAERGACGFGFLKQSAKLDQATADANLYFAARAAESVVSARSFAHAEDGGKSGFTGQFPWDRAAFRGYGTAATADVNEDNASEYFKPASPLTSNALSARQLTLLLTSVYHVAGLMTARTEVGFAFTRTTTADGWDTGRLNLTVGIPTGDLRQTSTAVRTYPCQGTTNVAGTFVPSNESPNPAPDLGAALIGTPIYVNGPEGQTITVTDATVTPSTGGAAIASRLLTYANDPVFTSQGVHALRLNETFVLPLTPLTKGAAYTVAVTGSSNGVPFSRVFTFTPSL